MQLTYELTRQNPGNRQPVLNGTIPVSDPLTSAASLSMSFFQEAPGRNYRYTGKATLSFIGGQLNDEHCNVWGSITTVGSTTRYYGCVTYRNLQPSAPLEGLIFIFLGDLELPGPQFHPSAPLPLQQQVVRPTDQQLQNQAELATRANVLIRAATSLLIAQEVWP